VLNEKDKGSITEQEIIDWCKDKMASYKRPREVAFINEIPMSGPGKILRRKLV